MLRPFPLRPPEQSNGSSLAELECRYEVEELDEAAISRDLASAPPVDQSHPFKATVCSNWCLCTDDHASEEQDVRNVCFEAPLGTSYRAGDVCVVWPRAEAKQIRRFVVETLELKMDKVVRIRPKTPPGGGGLAASSIFPDAPVTLEQIFSLYVDIGATPSRHFFQVLAQNTTDELHQQKLTQFASRTLEAKDALYEYCKREKRSAAEVMFDFWTARPPLAELLSAMTPMRPRRYSIASCPRWNNADALAERLARFWMGRAALRGWTGLRGRAALGACAEAMGDHLPISQDSGCRFDLCVGIVRSVTKTNRTVEGLCSTFLQKAAAGTQVWCSFEPGQLVLPPLAVPMILVCPGTGLSPCRALVQERHLEIAGMRGGRPARFDMGLKDLMFLGFRHERGDFLYGPEWSTFSEWLATHIAFSRDHEDRKVYVQDQIEEQGEHVCRLLDAGAQIFVCGRAHPMPAQVFDAFAEVLQVHRGIPLEDAAARLREMQRTQRYICDTWG